MLKDGRPLFMESTGDDSFGGETAEMRERRIRMHIDNIRGVNKNIFPLVQGYLRGEVKELDIRILHAASEEILVVHDILEESEMSDYFKHDLDADSRHACSNLMSITGEEDDKDFDRQTMQFFVKGWRRFYVAVEDMLLRKIYETKISKEDVSELNLEVMKDVIDYFGENEKSHMDKFAYEMPAYSNIEQKKFTNEIDFNALQAQLHDKEIKANTAVVMNLLLNEIRNSLKDKTEIDGVTTGVALSAHVEGKQLVLQVIDDGKGISAIDLDPESPSFIFRKGTTKTDSTGLGLANAQERIATMGAELRVISYRNDEDKTNFYPPESKFDLDEFNKNRVKEGKMKARTIFEIRLPIEDK
ncbi:MAG: ATP-binding protein [Candidatus Magasanikiibacteriota bacterium]